MNNVISLTINFQEDTQRGLPRKNSRENEQSSMVPVVNTFSESFHCVTTGQNKLRNMVVCSVKEANAILST